MRPHGEKVARNSDACCKPLVEVDLLAHTHPAFHPRLMYYNVSLRNLLSFLGAISLQREIRIGRGHQERFMLFSCHPPFTVYIIIPRPPLLLKIRCILAPGGEQVSRLFLAHGGG